MPLDSNEYIIFGMNRIFLINLDFSTNVVEMEINDVETQNLVVFPPFPNPTKNEINIKILWMRDIVNESEIDFLLYDIHGAEVARLNVVETYKLSSNYAIMKCSLPNVSSGYYFLQVKAFDYNQTVPIIIE